MRVTQFRICSRNFRMFAEVAMPGVLPIQDFAVNYMRGRGSPTTDQLIARQDRMHVRIGGEWESGWEERGGRVG